VVRDDGADLADQDVEDDRTGHGAELFEPGVHPPQWAQIDALSADRWQ